MCFHSQQANVERVDQSSGADRGRVTPRRRSASTHADTRSVAGQQDGRPRAMMKGRPTAAVSHGSHRKVLSNATESERGSVTPVLPKGRGFK